LATRAEAQAAKLSHSVREYREYLGQFPNGASASVVKSRLAEAMAKPENLGSNVNSYASELAPMISPDGRTLYYVRDGHAGNDGDGEDQDIWISSQDDLGDWLPAEHPGFPLNNTDPNGVLSVTPDGNSLLLNGGYDGANGFALSHRDSRGWSYPERIEVRNYYNLSHYIAAYLANDARTLLMSIERSDSRGERDLYVSFLGSGGQWSEPRSLGKTVNTSADEGSPFLASDGVTLFFSSYGHKGYGSSDVFVTRRLDNTWRKWSTPVNLGPAINTDDFENSFIIPAAGDYAYYTSSASGQGGEDIFRIAVPEFARPKAVVLVTGRVVDQKTGEPLSASIVYETLADGKEVGSARSDPKTGLYKIALPAGATYGFRAESDGYIAVSDNLDLSALRQYEERRADLVLVPMEVGQSVRLNNLFFDFGKATLRKESFSELGRLADVLRRNPNMAVEIAGHTDSVGTAERNQELSQQRANAVAMYLKGKGIGNERVTVAGYGATKPLAPNETEEGRQRNRRVEFVILRR
jgi:outer membrane protein OmpA-like peptidoglycan-associated protein